MLERYQRCRYRDGGRGPVHVDCWGLARMVRHEQFGHPLLPSFGGVDPNDKASASQAFALALADLRPVAAEPGAIALCWSGSLAIHCGIVVERDGHLGVMEADEGVDVRWMPLRKFARRFNRVEFYS